MTKTCPECGLSLQGRDNEADTCSDCLLGLTNEQYKEKPIKMNTTTTTEEILLDPIETTEALMLHIFDAEFGGELDPNHRFFELYLQLQLLKEKMLKDEEDTVLAIEGDEVKS
jgi:hypothetical protein